MKTVGKRVSEWNCSRVLTAGLKKKQHHCALLQLTTLANTGYIGFSRRVVEVQPGRDCCSSFLWHERQWQPFCCLATNYGSLPAHLTARMDRMGGGGQNRCSAGNSSFLSSQALIQSIGQAKVTGGSDLGRKPG